MIKGIKQVITRPSPPVAQPMTNECEIFERRLVWFYAASAGDTIRCTDLEGKEMHKEKIKFPRLDKTKFSVHSLTDDLNDKDYWISKSANERLAHIELLRVLNYGDQASSRLQRLFEIAELS